MSITIPEYDGCDWPVDPGCLGDAWATYAPDVQERAIHLASATLYRLTGYRVGGCPVKVRPSRSRGCSAVPSAQITMSPFTPVNWAGSWTNVWCGTREDPRLVELPGPVGEVYEVKVDGVVINASRYTVLDGNVLAYTGAGDSIWPEDQDWVLDDSEEGTFSVTYLNAYRVDGQGAAAAGTLALEFAAACAAGGTKCRLPANVVSITRQGVSYEMAIGAFPDGKTQIREVDNFIEKWNPRNRQPGMLFDPGAPKVHVDAR